ncbi:TIR domain-containing protein [Streptomyces sp. R28]|uniref:TIR domain-containing protein n=1 Tax=Streptomyces sp. R28 TaxID=3238628 RepID=A0AB39Q9S3_9ACTN
MGHGGNAAERQRPRVFISYAHDDEAHIEQVETLYELLRKRGGLDARLDLYAAGTPQDWARWMERQCADADYTLVIASPQYKLRAERGERDGVGRGVGWESRLLRNRVYNDSETWFEKILLILLPGRREQELPAFLVAEQVSHFKVPSLDAAGIEELVRYMWHQPYRVEPALGPIPAFGIRPPLVPASGQPRVVDATSGAAEPVVRDLDGCPGGLDEAAWRQLAQLLGGVRPESWAGQAYHWSFGATGSPGRAAAPFGTPDGDLYAWAEDLGERRHTPGTVPKPVTFAHALAAGYAAGESPADLGRARALASWVDRFLDSRALPMLPDAPGIKRGEATLTVRLTEHPQRQDRFYAEIWLRTTDGRQPRRLQPPEESGSLAVDMDGARDLLQESMRNLAGALADGEQGLGSKLERIEFAVFDGLLEETFEQWPLRLRSGPCPIGKLYEVVVRCPDQRWEFDLPQLWARRWDWLTERSRHDERPTAWVADEDIACLNEHIGAWRKNDRLACVAVSMSPAQEGVYAALDVGMPIVVWQRDGHRGDPTVPPLNTLLALDKVADVADLPETVAQLRRSTHLPEAARSSVVLLWDDPYHSPAADPLSDANLIA